MENGHIPTRTKLFFVFCLLCGFVVAIFTFFQSDLKIQFVRIHNSTSMRFNLFNDSRTTKDCHRQISTVDNQFLLFHRKISQEPTYIFSAIHSSRYTLDHVVLTGASHAENKYVCCYIDQTGSVYGETISYSIRRPSWSFMNDTNHFLPFQYMCPYNKLKKPRAATLTRPHVDCPTCDGDYKPIIVPPKHPGKVAVCVPFLYGGIPPSHLIEYIEYYKLFGVHKVYLYYLKDKQKIQNILAYYQEQGFVEVIIAEFPGRLKGMPERTDAFIKRIGLQFHSDLQFAINDCIERTSGYSFVGVYDLDELLVPKNGDFNISHLIEGLLKEFPDAGGFTAVYELLPLGNWPPTHPAAQLERRKYRRKVKDFTRNSKSIHIPKRLDWRNVHFMYPRTGFKSVNIPEKYATLHHYRNGKGDYNISNSYVDTSLDSIEDRWQKNVASAKKVLEIP